MYTSMRAPLVSIRGDLVSIIGVLSLLSLLEAPDVY
jgi:hypothetical protein